MNKFQNTIGIDVSKDSLDAHDHCNGKCLRVPNGQVGFKQLVAWMKVHNEDEHAVLWAFEHTGMYPLPLAIYLSQKNISYIMVPGLEIKKIGWDYSR
jgi:transposase